VTFFADAQPDSIAGAYGWIAAGVATVLGAVGTFWALLRKDRREDTTTALTHANRIIAGHERYAERRDKRIVELEDEIRSLWRALGDTDDRERRCLSRVEWLCTVLRQHDIDVPPWMPEAGNDG
jgi:hypothetical protein